MRTLINVFYFGGLLNCLFKVYVAHDDGVYAGCVCGGGGVGEASVLDLYSFLN